MRIESRSAALVSVVYVKRGADEVSTDAPVKGLADDPKLLENAIVVVADSEFGFLESRHSVEFPSFRYENMVQQILGFVNGLF